MSIYIIATPFSHVESLLTSSNMSLHMYVIISSPSSSFAFRICLAFLFHFNFSYSTTSNNFFLYPHTHTHTLISKYKSLHPYLQIFSFCFMYTYFSHFYPTSLPQHLIPIITSQYISRRHFSLSIFT